MPLIMDKLKKNSRIKESARLDESIFFGKREQSPTDIPMLNVALSGSVDGGLESGLTMLAGPSKHFKTNFALTMAKGYLDKHKDGILLFYDSEFGSAQSYFEFAGIDINRVYHTPIKNIESLKFDIVSQLEQIERKDKVIIIIDSVGNLASKKEVEDAIKENTAADMTRAKQLKSLFRIVTPYLQMNDIPLLAINHTYADMGLFPKQVVSGGTGGVYSSDNIYIIGRRQQKEGTEISGYEFVIKAEKSRVIKEGSQIPISVSFNGGIQKYSGLLDIAIEGKYVAKPTIGWYSYVDQKTGEILEGSKKVRAAETLNKEFWDPVFENTDFADYIKRKYTLVPGPIVEDNIKINNDVQDKD